MFRPAAWMWLLQLQSPQNNLSIHQVCFHFCIVGVFASQVIPEENQPSVISVSLLLILLYEDKPTGCYEVRDSQCDAAAVRQRADTRPCEPCLVLFLCPLLISSSEESAGSESRGLLTLVTHHQTWLLSLLQLNDPKLSTEEGGSSWMSEWFFTVIPLMDKRRRERRGQRQRN